MLGVTALCAVVGGLLWVVACVHRSTLPSGCVGEECLVRPMRGDTPLGTALSLAAAVLRSRRSDSCCCTGGAASADWAWSASRPPRSAQSCC